MLAPVRKNLSEYGYLLKNSFFAFIPAHEITNKDLSAPSEHEQDLRASHVYLVLKRKRFTLNPITLTKKRIDRNTWKVSGHLAYSEKGVKNTVPFEVKVPANVDDKLSLSDYPYDRFIISPQKGETTFFPASILAQSAMKKSKLIDYEVLYVGMAFGKTGERGVRDRLKSHSTLQKIFGDVYAKSPEDEIWVCALRYDTCSIVTSMDGRADIKVDDENEAKRFKAINDYKISNKEITCLVEAGLIRYFQPEYNDIYKVSFPKKSQKILQKCYELDVSGMVVELEISIGHTNIFSENQKSGNYHYAKYDFFNPKVRAGFSHLTLDKGKTVHINNPGAVSAFPKI